MPAPRWLLIAITGAVAVAGAPAGAHPGADAIVLRTPAWHDAWLAAKTTVALFRDWRVSGAQVAQIVVAAEGDRVILRGVVDRPSAAKAAEALAHRVPGVRSVGNELRVVPATAPSPRPVAELAPAVAEALRRTQTIDDWALASRLARAVPGVHHVRNLLAIEDMGPIVDWRGPLAGWRTP